ncbi:MAG TPA: DUF1028 domain-containing protein [Solirubrobacteraceae bacterium]
MTYSIVARDPATGELGVAVQSHWFSVGSIVPWARSGVGAVATQAIAEVSYGPRALALLGEGADAGEALGRLVAEDSGASNRQVAVVDSRGAVAVHTGERCVRFAGHQLGDGFGCQANMMASDRVWPAMADAYASTPGRLAERLLAALDAGEAAGGDVRGRQSAGLLVVPADGDPWSTAVSLRVEDDPEPLRELRRLLVMQEAYSLAAEGERLTEEGRHGDAVEHAVRSWELAPENPELRFWAGLAMAQAGMLEQGVEQVRVAIAAHPPWRELLGRLPPEWAPAAPAVLEALGTGER